MGNCIDFCKDDGPGLDKVLLQGLGIPGLSWASQLFKHLGKSQHLHYL